MKSRLFRWFIYFKAGHGAYLTFLLSFANFIVIQYNLLISSVPLLATLFPRFAYFIATFIIIYIPTSTVIGWIDYKRGTVPVQQALGASVSPWAQDLAQSLILICDGKTEEAKKILQKWTGQKA